MQFFQCTLSNTYITVQKKIKTGFGKMAKGGMRAWIAYEKHPQICIVQVTINNDHSGTQGIIPDYCTPN